MTTLRVAEVEQAAPVRECEACEERGQEVFAVGDHFLCAGCARQYLEGGGDRDAVDAFAATLREMEQIADALDPAKRGWARQRAAIANGQLAVAALRR